MPGFQRTAVCPVSELGCPRPAACDLLLPGRIPLQALPGGALVPERVAARASVHDRRCRGPVPAVAAMAAAACRQRATPHRWRKRAPALSVMQARQGRPALVHCPAQGADPARRSGGPGAALSSAAAGHQPTATVPFSRGHAHRAPVAGDGSGGGVLAPLQRATGRPATAQGRGGQRTARADAEHRAPVPGSGRLGPALVRRPAARGAVCLAAHRTGRPGAPLADRRGHRTGHHPRTGAVVVPGPGLRPDRSG